MTQAETIVWREYPKEKPPKEYDDYVLISFSEYAVQSLPLYWEDETPVFYALGEIRIKDGEIVAWAEMPKGIGELRQKEE